MFHLDSKKLDPLALNLRRLMVASNVSEAEIARKTSIPQPTIHKILTGKTSDPRASTLSALASFFNVSIDELVTGQESRGFVRKINNLPIISWEQAIKFEEVISNLQPSNWDKWVVTEPLPSNCFALLSKPSMEPRFPKGTALVIDPNLKPEDGDILLVYYPDTNEATMREISIDGPSVLLSCLYGASSSEQLTNNIKTLGVLIKSIFSYHE